ncbi:MAG: DUF3786 domain-containing protein [Desulfobacteraceae bacterium]|nr:DUF3786 domain-containing protein [Desulfobacteraceae bacterium]
MENKSLVFEKHYNDYLQQLEFLDFEAIALKLGGQINKNFQGKFLTLSFFGQSFNISPQGITDSSGKKPYYDICIILCRHLLMCPEISPHERQWVAFRDLKDSGPLTIYFRDNVEQAITKEFAGKIEELKQCMAALSGYAPGLDVSYDLAIQVDGLPKIPMVVLFNDAEELFPSKCSILFEKQAETYLDAECIAMLGHQLVSQLKHARNK